MAGKMPWSFMDRGGAGFADPLHFQILLQENDDQRIDGQGLDEGQAENQSETDVGIRSRIARDRFRGSSGRPSLADTAEARGNSHADHVADGPQAAVAAVA